jgi:hypothetical protein
MCVWFGQYGGLAIAAWFIFILRRIPNFQSFRRRQRDSISNKEGMFHWLGCCLCAILAMILVADQLAFRGQLADVDSRSSRPVVGVFGRGMWRSASR